MLSIEDRVSRLERALNKVAETVTREYPLRGNPQEPGIVACQEIAKEIGIIDDLAAAAARRDALRRELDEIEDVL